jgi:hypothetical protein
VELQVEVVIHEVRVEAEELEPLVQLVFLHKEDQVEMV